MSGFLYIFEVLRFFSLPCFVRLSICPSVHSSAVHPPIHPSICLSICLSRLLSIRLFFFLVFGFLVSWETREKRKTRPDTRPPVADGWAGAEMRVFPLLDSMVTDGPTNQWTDGRTEQVGESRATFLILGHFEALMFS